MPTPLITVVVCLPDGTEYVARSMFGVAPMVGDTLIYPHQGEADDGLELTLDVWDRIIKVGPSAGAELRTTITGPDRDDEVVLEVLERLRFRKRS